MEDFSIALEGKSREELMQMLTETDSSAQPQKYRLIQEKIKLLESREIETATGIQSSHGLPHTPQQNNIEIHTREFANVFTRFGAIVIDGLLFVPFYIPIFLISKDLEYKPEPPEYFYWLFIITFFAMFIFGIWNTIIRMGKTGQSLGRKFLNIAVLTADGKPIGIGKAALREIIGRWISGLVCYIGYLNAFWDKHKQMWHDKIANCYVYYVENDFS